MTPFYQSLLDIFLTLHAEIRKTYAGLAQQALDWAPGTEMNSFAVLVTHVAGAERYWVGDVALGEPSNRQREQEFETTGLSAAQLDARMDAADDYLRAALERLVLADLEAARVSPRNGKEVTLGWALLHALEHTAVHVGHLQMLRQLWEARTPAE